MTDVMPPEGEDTFALRIEREANERLTELSAQSESVNNQIEALLQRREIIARETELAERIARTARGEVEGEPSSAATEVPARVSIPDAKTRWENAPEPDAVLMKRAETFLREHEGNFTLGDLTMAVAPAEDIIPSNDAMDTLLTQLLTSDRILTDHEGVDDHSSVVRYVAVIAKGDDEPPPHDEAPEPETEDEPEDDPSPELESARSEEGGVQTISDSAPSDSERGATPGDDAPAAPVLPVSSGADRMEIIDEAVTLYLGDHPGSTRQEIMEALTLTDGAASRSLTRLTTTQVTKIIGENPSRWSLAAEPETKDEPEADAPTAERESRRGSKYITLEVVRDAAKQIGEAFNTRTLAEWMTKNMTTLGTVNPPSLLRYIRELHENGTLERTGGKAGPSVKYQYVKPTGGGPTHRPRTEHPRQLPKGASLPSERGEAVPHTGRAKGRSDKSSTNKKNQARGFRVKTARGDRKRAG